MSNFEPSDDQKRALKILHAWHKSDERLLTLGGYAGTGKTTLVSQFRKELYKKEKKLKVAFCSFTGKASRVLENTLKQLKALYPKDFTGTIHSMIYEPILDGGEILGWSTKDELKYDLIITDEASMIDKVLWRDLISFGVPVLAVGDIGQLPPISGSFNLMDDPQVKLTQIHRQAKGNPIIELSIMAREEGKIPFGIYGDSVRKLDSSQSDTVNEIDDILLGYDDNLLVLCGMNHTRVKLNKHTRALLEIHSEEPVAGDRVICLRNNHDKDIYNGMLGTISYIESNNEETYLAEISFDGEKGVYSGLIASEQFGNKSKLQELPKTDDKEKVDLFDFGYALTVHKAQGSQAPKVLLFEERFSRMSDEDWRRWLYTAVTRAQSELTIIARDKNAI